MPVEGGGGGVYRPSLSSEATPKMARTICTKLGSRHSPVGRSVGRSVGERNRFFGRWQIFTHVAQSRAEQSRGGRGRHHATHKLHVQMIAGSCSLSLSPLPLALALPLHQGRRCQGVHQNSDFKRSCDSRRRYRLTRHSAAPPSLAGTRGMRVALFAIILCPE